MNKKEIKNLLNTLVFSPSDVDKEFTSVLNKANITAYSIFYQKFKKSSSFNYSKKFLKKDLEEYRYFIVVCEDFFKDVFKSISGKTIRMHGCLLVKSKSSCFPSSVTITIGEGTRHINTLRMFEYTKGVSSEISRNTLEINEEFIKTLSGTS